MNTTDRNNETLGMKIPDILYKRYYTEQPTFKSIEQTVKFDINELIKQIKDALYEHGVYSLDAIRFIWTNTYNDGCYLCICACGVKAAMKVNNGIQAEQFIKNLDNFAELISGRIFNIDDMSEFDNINVKAFDWEIPEDCHK